MRVFKLCDYSAKHKFNLKPAGIAFEIKKMGPDREYVFLFLQN